MDEAMGVLQDVQQRDDNLYRVIFQADPIPSAIRKAGYGGTNRYEHLMDMANSDLVVNTTQKMDMLTKQLYIQSRSFDDVVEMCKNHDEMLRCIPAIQPISNKDLRKTASGYGTRIDPIYGTTRFHAGMDFRPIRERMYMQPVTALLLNGMGNRLWKSYHRGSWLRLPDVVCPLAGIPYQTRQTGGAGRGYRCGWKYRQSTGPHLHYEVHVKGQVVNPVNYYFMDLSAEDYDRMIQIAANHGK